MGRVQSAIVVVCTVLGTLFTAATLYLVAAPFFDWWPAAQKLLAPAPPVAPPMLIPAGVLSFFGLLGIALLVTAWVQFSKNRRPSLKAIPTSLRLQFQPNSLNPTNLQIENISNWYALRESFIVHEAPSKKFKQGRQIESRHWIIFLVFDQPVAIKQILFDGNGVQLPQIEVKDRSPRHAMIIVSGDLGSVVLDIKVVI